MRSHHDERSARAAWCALALALGLSGIALVVPPLRSPLACGASVVAVTLVLAGMAWHRNRSFSWALIALMLICWGTGDILQQLAGAGPRTANIFIWAGQAVAVTVTVHTVRNRAASAGRSPAAVLDLVVIAVVLALVGLQLATTNPGQGDHSVDVVVASIDVTLIGLLIRFSVSHRGLRPSSYLMLLAAALTIAYDLFSAVHGRRLALPGEVSQSLGVIGVLMFGIAAIHPSMVTVFAPETFARRRRPSASLLGLLPLVLVPAALWWVADLSGTSGLPTWAVPLAGAMIAGLCLLRAASALRASEHLAEHDPLTDLANRRGLAEAFAEAPPPAGRSLLLIDVDDFKQVNDTHGHDIGDALLLHVRDRFLAATSSGGFVARLGGDEFVILVDSDLAPDVAQRILRSLREPFVLDDLVLRVGASIGIAEAPPDTTLAQLLTHADVAMYAAKAAGGGTAVTFQPKMRVEIARRFTLTSEIRQLLGSETPGVGRLEIHYQPLVELETGEVIGAEALVRWRHPERGLLTPDAFLSLVSNGALDVQLDSAVLRDVLDHLARWHDQGRRCLPVSINLTRDSLNDPQLADRILISLEQAGVSPSQLHVEITEHDQLLEDSPAAHTLHTLRAAGIGIYLDDYGTGYTSLDYLRRFPVQVLKLDRSVVTSVTEEDVQLVAGVNAMAAALALDVLAEGVETVEQRARLVELGVRFGQGYLFSRPLPPDEYADRMLGPARAVDDATPVVPAPRLGETDRSRSLA